jgi:ferritin-like metal-binding protein YciE
MPTTVELDDELAERIEDHLEEDESHEEFIEELMNIYESSRFVREGYSE